MNPSSRPTWRQVVAASAVLAATAATVAVSVTTSAAATPLPANAIAQGASTTPDATVTLITGDKVTVQTLADGQHVASVQRPKNLTGGIETMTIGKDLYVYPSEVLPYLAAGVLDQRLFDVTKLIADGYDDSHTSALPLIVQYGSGSSSTLPGLTTERALSAIHGASAKDSRSQAAKTWQNLTPASALGRAKERASKINGKAAQTRSAPADTTAVFGGNISHIWLDGKVKATLADSTAQIGAPDDWNAGVDGTGVNVAILDTGIDAGHPDFAGQIASTQSFVPGEDMTDVVGHGTHTASTIAGTGAASGGLEKGVAPGAHLLVGKVLDDQGEGDDSWIIAGMQWAAETEHAKIISMSLGSTDPSDGTDPMSQAVNDLSASTGTLFVIAAGNSGPGGIGSPGAATAALTVGAVDSTDALAYFSSWGPRLNDGGLKPELTAPGVDILAARSEYSPGSGYYVTMSGTSMATPHVAGTAALVAEEHPDWTGQQIKDDLVSTTHETPDIPVTQGGTGRVDAKAAVLGTIDASATAWSGFYPWPHTADQPTSKTITYTNTGSTDVTLDLAAHATDEDGTPAPSGVFTLGASTVTVPADGSATVAVTADPNAADYGATDGIVEATEADGTAVAHTLIGVDREPERYNLTVKATDRTGAPISGQAVLYKTGDPYASIVSIPETGEITLREPAGEYSLLMYADLPGADGPDGLGLGVLSVPQIELTQDREADLDARQAHQVSAVAPQSTQDELTRVEWNRTLDDGNVLGEEYMLPNFYTSVWAQATVKPTDGSFHFDMRWRKTVPPLAVTANQSSIPTDEFSDIIIQAGSTMLPAGTNHLDVVYAGLGTAADFSGVNAKGKAVVVEHVTQADFLSQAQVDADQAANAVAAGAKLLLVVNDGVGRVSEWYGSSDFESTNPIEIASLRADEGAALIAAAKHPGFKLTVTSTPTTPYVYDLVERYDDAIPATDLTYRPTAGDLARIDTSFAGNSDTPGYDGRFDLQNFDPYAVFFETQQQLGTTRTDWVTPGNGQFTWYQLSGFTNIVEERAPVTDPKAGSRTSKNWFSAVIHPRLGDSILPDRQGNYFSLNVPAWGDGGNGDTGYDYGDYQETPDLLQETVSLYQGSTLIKSTNHQQLNIFNEVSPDPLPYRLVADTSQSTVFPTSSSTHTEWDFTSGNGYYDLPLIQLDYGVATDMSGEAPRHTTLTFTASQMPGVTGAGSIRGGTLQLSFDDGATWVPVALHPAGAATWTVDVAAPHSAQFVSLRATAQDDAGNTVSQTVLRAYAVK